MATWLTGKEAAAHLRVSRPTFYRLIREGTITAYSIPTVADPRYKQEELDALLTPVSKDEANKKG
jgi:excisionase family DNA binding protein